VDEKDSLILKILRNNSRMSNSEIARNINVSEATVRKRIKHLKDSGIIRRFTIETTDTQISSIILIKTETRKTKSVLNSLMRKYDDVYELTGSQDIAVHVKRNTIDEINSEVDRIRVIEGVENTDTLIRLS
jgi:Lrp/AsnC family transcriptional regulator of lysine biosynthesis